MWKTRWYILVDDSMTYFLLFRHVRKNGAAKMRCEWNNEEKIYYSTFLEPWWWKDKSLDSTKEVKNIFKRRRCFLMNTALFKLKNHHQRWKIDEWSSSTVTLELVSSFLIFGCYNHLRQQARFLFMTLRYCANHHRFYLQHHRLLTTCFPI